MTAQDQMRKMLDQLMGQDRDGGNEHSNLKFTDKEVCRPFLLDICINDLFTNTRADLGECNKIHSLALRSEYEKATTKRDYEYEEEILQYLQSFIKDNERKIELAKKRLEMQEKNPELEAKAQVVHELGIQIGEQVAKSEALGAEGKVDESLAVLAEVETLKTKKKEAEDAYFESLPRNIMGMREQILRPCDVCGAMLGLYEKDSVLADHFGGKLHMGYVTIRDKIKALEAQVEEKAKTRRERLEERRLNKEKSDSREEKRRSRSRSRERRRRSRSQDKD
ncbi:putative RNA-binding protein Luc7-like 1 [Dysidea avara]|uniref:putative RNA-binding protein Luc7-like 1 n=1 Tax=Dysidea avara TaxID=196820 RepID=UPI00331E0645